MNTAGISGGGDIRWKIRKRYGYRDFSDAPAQWRLLRWLYALCWTGTDRPSVLFDQVTAWLVAHKVLLPGASVLERTIARVRDRANSRLWRLLAARITADQKERLEALLIVPENARQSPMDRLRSGPVLQSSAELTRAIKRLGEARQLAAGLPLTDKLPNTRILALARFANAAKAQAVARMPDERRAATLLAFIRVLEASAQDDVLDLFDVIVTKIWADAVQKGRDARLRGLGDLDAAALTLKTACSLVVDNEIEDSDLRKTIFAIVPTVALEAAMAQIDSLARPPDDPYFKELLDQYQRIRRFLPHFVRNVSFGAMPAGQPILKALQHLQKVEDGKAHGLKMPLEFVPKSWLRRVIKNDLADRRAWTLCLADRLRGAIRRRDIFAAPSLRFADPRIGMLEGAAWEAARPTVCRTLGRTQNVAEEINALSERLDQAYRFVAGNLPKNASLRIEQNGASDDLILTGLDRLEEPPSLVALRKAVSDRLPQVDLPELLLEIDARTGFAAAFTHASEADSRAGELRTSICAVLVAEACNTGFEPLLRKDIPSLRRARLSWVRQNYIREETLTQANARLVAAQNGIDLARRWGGGDVASADGLQFVVPVRTIHAGPNPKYFGPERGVTYYNLVSDQFTGLNVITVPGTLRDSLVLLSVVLEQETDLEPTEIMTDTEAYTDVIFGIFWLHGYQFSPRIADIGGARFWRIDPKADYGALSNLALFQHDFELRICSIAGVTTPADPLPQDLASAHAMILAQREALILAQSKNQVGRLEIERLKLMLAKLRREQFGQSSERGKQLIEQLELAIEDLEESQAAEEAKAEAIAPEAAKEKRAGKPRGPRKLPDTIPVERQVEPPPCACIKCGSSRLHKLGETVSKTLECEPRRWKIIEHVREKFSCRDCEAITEPPAPSHAIPRGFAGPSLLAMILVAKFLLHQPLNRQSATFAREGIEIDTSTLADRVGACVVALDPIVQALKTYVLSAARIHTDDTTLPVLAKMKTVTGRIWTYVRDDRPFGGQDPPAAFFEYSRSRAGEYPQKHLAGFTGILQADAFAGYVALYDARRRPAPMIEAACWSHGRRNFFDLAKLSKAPIAIEAVRRIDELFEIERTINGKTPEQRVAVRQEKSKSLVLALEAWLREQRDKLSSKSETTKAINYCLTRWTAFTRFLDDGRICLSNNAAERAVRGVAVGRKNWTFAGSDAGGHRAAAILTLIETCKMNDVDPQAWLADILARLPDHPAKRIHELFPWNWKMQNQPQPKAA